MTADRLALILSVLDRVCLWLIVLACTVTLCWLAVDSDKHSPILLPPCAERTK